MRSYETLVVPKSCSDDIEIIVGIKTQPKNHDRRQAIRKSWGNSEIVQNESLSRKIEKLNLILDLIHTIANYLRIVIVSAFEHSI